MRKTEKLSVLSAAQYSAATGANALTAALLLSSRKKKKNKRETVKKRAVFTALFFQGMHRNKKEGRKFPALLQRLYLLPGVVVGGAVNIGLILFCKFVVFAFLAWDDVDRLYPALVIIGIGCDAIMHNSSVGIAGYVIYRQ